MKYSLSFATVLLAIVFLTSCEKSEIKLTPLASLNVTNAVVSGKTVKFGSRATSISNNNYTQFGLVAGDNNLYIYQSTDSLKPYYTNNKFSASQGEIYSLFLCGDTLAPEGVIIKETIPHRTDSTAGIRFINLSPSSTPLNITLSTATTLNEVSDLAYKQYTEFKSYPGLYNSTYTFQIRDATSADPLPPLATFSLSAAQVPRFANITLVIRQNGSGVSVFRVNNDR